MGRCTDACRDVSGCVWTGGLVWNQTTPVLKMPMGLMYASIPTGAVFMLINTIIVVYYQITGEDVK